MTIGDNMEHAPGPWFWNSYDAIWAGKGDYSERIASVSHLEYDDEGEEVASHGDEISGPRKSEARANARLIAAAPALLEALEDVIQSISDDPDYPLDEPYLSARKAIEAAKGEA